MIIDEPTRPGVHRFWPRPSAETTKDTAALVMVRRDKTGALFARQFHPKPENEIEVLASEMHGRWEFVPETPIERQVFRRRR